MFMPGALTGRSWESDRMVENKEMCSRGSHVGADAEYVPRLSASLRWALLGPHFRRVASERCILFLSRQDNQVGRGFTTIVMATWRKHTTCPWR